MTVERATWFADLTLGREVVKALRHEDARAGTLAYVVMPDHLHWLVQLKTGDLSISVGNVKSASSRAVNRALGRAGSLWQPGFQDHSARRDEDVRELARYLIANPVRAGLVESVRQYPLWDAVWL